MPPSKTKVYSEGPTPCKLMCIGEAPGAEEAGQGRPFVGKSGQLLERYLGRNGILRSEVRLANLSLFRPSTYHNKFTVLLDTPELEESLSVLEEDIKATNPNCILALGGWPTWFLAEECGIKNNKKVPGSGILKLRGSRFQSLERWGSREVLSTMHPAYLLRRGNWYWNPVWNLDIKNAIEDSAEPGLILPVYEEHIDPLPDTLYDLVHETLSADLVALDIETFPNPPRYSCVGWAWKKDGVYKGCTITLHSQGLERYAREVWESEVPKTLQYGTYDIPFMRRFYGWKIGGYYGGKGWDTYVASASLLPDYPRRLDFLCSIHTRFPYYKDERKVWKERGSMTTLWKYNIKDCVATLQIAEEQMGEVSELFKVRRAA